jgi:hypothetical protein
MPKSPSTALPQDDPPAHTLDSIAAALGPADPALEAALLEGADDAALVALGRTIKSPHLVTDERRLYSIAFDVWQNATPEQKDNLRGFSPELLAVAVAHARKLAEMAESHDERAGAAAASRESRLAAARASFSAALTLRDQAANVLRGVAGQDKSLSTLVDGAVGTADDGAALAKGLEGLAAVGRNLLQHKKDAVAKRAKLMRLDAGYLAKIEAAAKQVRETAQAAAARSGGKAITQGALDREDGVNAIILGHILDVFETAHDVDPTIPRLVPIATRRLFGKHKKKGAAPTDSAKTGDGEDPKK